jgi:hypothetical protein
MSRLRTTAARACLWLARACLRRACRLDECHYAVLYSGIELDYKGPSIADRNTADMEYPVIELSDVSSDLG